MPASHSDMVRIFTAASNAAAFEQAGTFAAFVEISGLAYLSSYVGGWAEYSFRQQKLRPDVSTSSALWIPEALTFGELFEAARFVDHRIGGGDFWDVAARKMEAITGPGFYYFNGNGTPLNGFHAGGKRTLRHFPDGGMVRGIFGGAVYMQARIKPRECVLAAWRNVMGPTKQKSGDGFACLSSFELVKRDDGFLVLARDGSGICSRYVALIPLSQADEMRAMLPEADRAMLEATEAMQAAFEAGIETVEGKPQLRDARAEFVKGTFGESDGWQAEFRRDGTWFPVMNANGGCARYATKGAALDGAAIALGYQIHR